MSTVSNVEARVRATYHRLLIVAVLLSSALSTACGALAGEKTACDGLVYKESGLTRTEYLPCAGEMIAALDRLAPDIEKMLSGDREAKYAAGETLGELRSLLRKAGWRDMVERWDDRALTSLNVDIWNAFIHHEACLMVAGGLFGRVPLTESQQSGIRSECRAYRSAYRDASNGYRNLR